MSYTYTQTEVYVWPVIYRVSQFYVFADEDAALDFIRKRGWARAEYIMRKQAVIY